MHRVVMSDNGRTVVFDALSDITAVGDGFLVTGVRGDLSLEAMVDAKEADKLRELYGLHGSAQEAGTPAPAPLPGPWAAPSLEDSLADATSYRVPPLGPFGRAALLAGQAASLAHLVPEPGHGGLEHLRLGEAPLSALVHAMLNRMGEDNTREGLAETPARVAKAWQHWTQGYRVDVATLLKTFADGAEGVDEMVTVANIPFYSHCEHHLAPFFGTATISYLPQGRVVGLSKLSRVVDAFAQRLQVQERLTGQIADALQDHLEPLGAAVRIKARHLCMESRGVCKQGHHTVTTALRGAFKTDPAVRAEFLAEVR